MTAELALLIGKALGQSPEYWLNLQCSYDLETARKRSGRRLNKLRRLAAAAEGVLGPLRQAQR